MSFETSASLGTYFALYPDGGRSLQEYIEQAERAERRHMETQFVHDLTVSALVMSAEQDRVLMIQDQSSGQWSLPAAPLSWHEAHPQTAAEATLANVAAVVPDRPVNLVSQDPRVPLSCSVAPAPSLFDSNETDAIEKPHLRVDFCYAFIVGTSDVSIGAAPLLAPELPQADRAEWLYFNDARTASAEREIGRLCGLRMVAMHEWNRTA